MKVWKVAIGVFVGIMLAVILLGSLGLTKGSHDSTVRNRYSDVEQSVNGN